MHVLASGPELQAVRFVYVILGEKKVADPHVFLLNFLEHFWLRVPHITSLI
jgi:hypothetical protein